MHPLDVSFEIEKRKEKGKEEAGEKTHAVNFLKINNPGGTLSASFAMPPYVTNTPSESRSLHISVVSAPPTQLSARRSEPPAVQDLICARDSRGFERREE